MTATKCTKIILPLGALLMATLVPATTFALVIIDDHFADGTLGTNPDTGSGFNNVKLNGSDWTETGTVASHTLTDNAANRASLQSIDSFGANYNILTRVMWTISDWSRDNLDSGNGRLALGVAESGASGDDPFFKDVDGIWIGMNFDSDAHSGTGVSGITYIDGTTHTALGNSWQWDDNGVDTPGATLFDIATDGTLSREDRVGITMNAPDLTLILDIDQDSWSLDFSSTDNSVVLPMAQSGTFSDAGVLNDLSSAIVSVYHQGNGNHFVSIDRIFVEVPEPTTFVLSAFGILGMIGFLRRRKRR